jgi:EAL domain-containing protein (putative c-di-GMP-specific phosphodiesterase class I)/CRP-like cAMP-binding protein
MSETLRKSFPAGTEIFRSGDQGDCAYVIDEGEVEIAIPVSAERSIYNRLGPGELFGEMALIDGYKRVGSARAITDTQTRIVTSSQILDRLQDSDDIVAFVLRITLIRYRHLLQELRRDGPEGGARDGGQHTIGAARERLVLPDSQRAVAKLELETELREALANSQFELHYQPLVVLSDRRLAGFEALLRWQSPRYGLVSPDLFIPLAEETGLIVPICRWALGAATRALAGFQAAARDLPGAPGQDLTVSVNVTRHQIDDPATMAILDVIRKESGVDPAHLKLELTESVLMDDFARARDWIAEVKQRRIKLSIDDFGTGYSSLGYLHQFGVDELKIDRSFVDAMLSEPRSMEIIRAIIGLARGLGLRTVAEGIEQVDQAERLSEAGCDIGQGYYFSRPIPEADARRRIRERGLSFAS